MTATVVTTSAALSKKKGAATVMGTLMYGAGHVWAGRAHVPTFSFMIMSFLALLQMSPSLTCLNKTCVQHLQGPDQKLGSHLMNQDKQLKHMIEVGWTWTIIQAKARAANIGRECWELQ